MYSLSPQQISRCHQDGFLYPPLVLEGSELVGASAELEGIENN
jgi:hypothetical protein